MKDRTRPARERLLAVLLLAGFAFFAHANSLSNGFHFDDEHSLVGNPHIRRLANIPHFFFEPRMFSRNAGSQMYRPLVLLSYALNYWAGRYAPLGYHAVNLALHACVVILLFFVFLQMRWPRRRASLAAALFAVHPLTTEPVNYISSRSEVLAALFFLAALLFYLRRRRRFSAASLGSYALGLLSKSTALALPLVLLACDWSRGEGGWRRCGRRHWPYWALALVYVGGSHQLISEALVRAPLRSWNAQAATQAKALVYYLKLLMVPHPLSIEHQFFVSSSWLEAPVALGVLLWLSLGCVVWRLASRGRRALFWLSWGASALLPVVVVPLNVLVNEHRLYLVLAAFLGALFWLLRADWEKGAVNQVAGLALFCCILLSIQRNTVWASERSLWADARRKAPSMVRPHLRLGRAYREAGKTEAAEFEYRKALELDPQNPPALNNLGNIYALEGDAAAAELAYRAALKTWPDYVEALINLGRLYESQNRLGSALESYQRALPLGANREELYNNLGIVYLRLERYAEAEEALRRAVALQPGAARIYFNLGGALEGQGRRAEATAAYLKAVEVDTDYARAYYNLGLLFERAGKRERARWAYERFLDRWRGEARFAAEARRHLRELSDAPR